MKLPIASSPTQARQTKEQFANPDDYLDYELGKAVQELPPLYTRLVGLSLSFAVFGAIAWAALNKVDDVAVAPGSLIPGEEVQPVRSLSSGEIKYFNQTKVKEGQQVQKGELLITLDSEASQVDVETLSNQVRLMQRDIGRASKAADESQKARIQEAKLEYSRLRNNLDFAKLKERKECPFFASVYQELPGAYREKCKDAQNHLNNSKKLFEAQEQKIKQLSENYKTGFLSELNKRHEELESVKGKLEQAINQVSNQTIRAPITGIVYNVKVTEGKGTLQSGEELLSILPEGKELLLEADLPNQHRAFVRKKMQAKVKIDGLNYQQFGTIDGEVVEVAPNAVKDKDSGKAVYPIKIKLDPVMLKKRGLDKLITPGMSGTGGIVMQEKSVLSLLLEPVTRKFDDVFSK